MNLSILRRLRQPLSIPRPISQRLLAKPPVFAALSAALLAPSCVSDPSYGQHHRPPSGSHRPPGGSSSSAYNSGHADGSRDRERGRRYQPEPGESRLPPALRSDYRRGYDAGYRRSGGGGHSGWTQRRAYDDGLNHGRRDRASGLSRNPSRHLRDVPPAFQNDFRRGYTAGWGDSSPGRPPGPPLRPQRPVPY